MGNKTVGLTCENLRNWSISLWVAVEEIDNQKPHFAGKLIDIICGASFIPS